MEDLNTLKEMLWIKNSQIAHRGLHDIKKGIPENSLFAFKNALNHGYSMECDVRISKDDFIYVYHDKNTKRLCGEDLTFEKLDKYQIASLRLSNTEEHIPLLKELLTLVDSKQAIMIEIKPTNRYKKLVTLMMDQLKEYDGVYSLQSYSPIIIRYIKKKYPNVIRGLIAEGYGHPYQPIYPIWWLSQIKLWEKLCDPHFYNFNIKDLPNKKMDSFKKDNKFVISFTSRSQADLDFVKKNYDNVVFEGFIPKK